MPKLKSSIRGCLAVNGCFLAFSIFTPLALPQSTTSYPAPDEERERILNLIREVEASAYDPTISLQDLPALQEAFTQSTDTMTKEQIASALVRIGKKEDVYWSVLANRAQEIVESDAPYPLLYDASGRSVRGRVTHEFSEWAKNHNLSQDQALNQQLSSVPGEFLLLAITGDPRGLSVLRKGLQSPNYEIRAFAARGLVLLQDKDSIPLIIQAARQAPSEIQGFIARPLVAFDDPRARAAAEDLVPDKNMLQDLRERLKEKGLRAVW